MNRDLLGDQYRLWFIAISLMALSVRLAFLRYSTLSHDETEMASLVMYVLPCLKKFSFLQAMWRQWHMFTINIIPLQNLYPINIPIVWFFGPSELNFRFEAAIGGFLSCILIYFLVLRHSDKKTALFAMGLVAFNPFMIAFNRYDFGDSLQAAVFLLGVLCIDKFLENRRVTILLLSSFFFAISFLTKANAIIFIVLILFLYHALFKLRLLDIGIILAASLAIVLILFIDQLHVFLPSMFQQTRYLPLGEQKDMGIISLLIERVLQSWWFYTRAHVFYFEQTVLPLLLALLFFKQIKNKFFRVLFFFGVLYFLALYIQGRTFFRYMQMGIIMASAALAFVLARFADKRHGQIGTVCLIIYVLWSVFSHGTYILSQYHHIPYRYIKERIDQLKPAGRILIYGPNQEAGYYLSPTSHLWLDDTVDPCRVPVTNMVLPFEFSERAHGVRKIPADFNVLFDPSAVRQGDLLVVTGAPQMAGGEPNPLSLGIKKWGIRLWGIRQYGHGYLRDVRAFYEEYRNNERLQAQYVLLEKVFLSNTSDELAALILKKI